MKVVGQMVVGPGEADRWLEDSLKEFKRLVDDAVIVTCNATQKEINLIKSYGYWTYEDNREWGRYQPDIKTNLVRRIRKLQPTWIIPLDADETLPTIHSRTELDEVCHNKTSTYFYVVNLWNDEQHYVEGLSFWNVRGYKCPSEGNTQFLRKAVHCGNAPPYFYNQPARESYVPHILLHKGLMLPSDRQGKVERYNLYDPNYQYKGRQYYDALSSIESGEPYNEQAVVAKIQSEIDKL